MKNFLFVSLLTGLFTTGCTLDNNALNTVNTAMNILGQVANNNGVGEVSVDETSDNQASDDERSICLAKGWKTAYVTNYQDETDIVGWVTLRLVGTNRTINMACDPENCNKYHIGKKVKLKTHYVRPLTEEEMKDPKNADKLCDYVDGCWVDQIKVLN